MMLCIFTLAAGNAMAQQYVTAYDAGSPGAAYIVVTAHFPLPQDGICVQWVNPTLVTPDHPERGVSVPWVPTASNGYECTASVVFQGDASGAGNVWALVYYQNPAAPTMFPRELGWAYVGWY